LTCSITWPIVRAGLATFALALAHDTHAALAEVVAVVSAKSSITSLTKDQIKDIFLGKRTEFPDGSLAIPIDEVAGSAVRDEFYARFADMSPAQVRAHWSRIIFTGRGEPPKTAATGGEAKKLLLENHNIITYMDVRLVDSSVRVLHVP